jgi:hypothetical protein
MTESWAPDPLTPEEEAEYRKTVAEAREDEPAQFPEHVGEDPDDPPQIDRRSAIERYLPDEEKPPDEQVKPADKAETETEKKTEEPAKTEPERDEQGRFKAKETETAPAPDKPPEEVPKPKERTYPAWLEKIPETERKSAQEYIDNMHASRTQAREQKRQQEAEFKHRTQEWERIVTERIAEAMKGQQQPVEEPDPYEDPEGFKAFHQQRSQEAGKIVEQAQALTKEQQERQAFSDYLVAQEREFSEDHPDYTEAVRWAYQQELDARIAKWPGRKRDVVEQGLQKELAALQAQYYQEDSSWPEWAYQTALQIGWGKQQAGSPAASATTTAPISKAPTAGEKTAAAIQAGAQAAKTLGKGAVSGVGDLTLEDISNIKDPEEHTKAYLAWVEKQIGQSRDWRPS